MVQSSLAEALHNQAAGLVLEEVEDSPHQEEAGGRPRQAEVGGRPHQAEQTLYLLPGRFVEQADTMEAALLQKATKHHLQTLNSVPFKPNSDGFPVNKPMASVDNCTYQAVLPRANSIFAYQYQAKEHMVTND